MNTDTLLDACVEEVCTYGWVHFSFQNVSKRHNIPVSKLYDRFKNRGQIPQEVIRDVDRLMLDELEGETFLDSSPREILFEIIMTRLEAAEPYKKFIRVLWREWPADALSVLIAATQGIGSMGWILDRAGLNSTGIAGLMRLQGLTALYLWVVKVWLDDMSEDLGKTMASLDQGLDRVERIAKALSL